MKPVFDRFVIALPSGVPVSSQLRKSFARFGAEVCSHGSVLNLEEMKTISTAPDVPLSSAGLRQILEEHVIGNSEALGQDMSTAEPSVESKTSRPKRRPRARRNRRFELFADHLPAGDQPKAVQFLLDGLRKRHKCFQTLHGITGSGKTFMMANIIAEHNRPTLVLAPNKTLAAQLYNEFSRYFPKNRVEFFVSHFKFYQPEAYLPNSDKYIAKSSAVDHEIDRLRHAATKSLFERNDTIVVASVSSIYGLGLPTEYLESALEVHVGDHLNADVLADQLRSLNYVEDDDKVRTSRGFFSRLENCVQVSPPWEREGTLYKYSLKDGVVEELHKVDIVDDLVTDLGSELVLYPANHFVTPKDRLESAIQQIEEEADQCFKRFEAEGKLLEASRLQERVTADIEMMRKIGFCQGAENYSLYLSGRNPKEPPETLLDYMPRDGSWLLFVDESHVTVPQLSGMYAGNAARKRKLIQYGFRLPSAMENRPLNQKEFWNKTDNTIFVSATPGPFEIEKSGVGGTVEAVIRPTAVVDPTVDVVSTKGQLEHLTIELAKVAANGGRAIVTTITKKFAEDVSDCLSRKPPVDGILDRPLNVSFLHSGIDSVGRMQVLEAMRDDDIEKIGKDSEQRRREKLDVVVGVNLLREGIDMPSVQLVAILDADSEGFLRGETALIQTIGRAARNIHGHVIMYADTVTSAMERAIGETNRRRRLQLAYNNAFKIEPTTAGSRDEHFAQDDEMSLLDRIRKLKLQGGGTVESGSFRPRHSVSFESLTRKSDRDTRSENSLAPSELRRQMLEAANSQDFESAALLRDELLRIER